MDRPRPNDHLVEPVFAGLRHAEADAAADAAAAAAGPAPEPADRRDLDRAGPLRRLAAWLARRVRRGRTPGGR